MFEEMLKSETKNKGAKWLPSRLADSEVLFAFDDGRHRDVFDDVVDEAIRGGFLGG